MAPLVPAQVSPRALRVSDGVERDEQQRVDAVRVQDAEGGSPEQDGEHALGRSKGHAVARATEEEKKFLRPGKRVGTQRENERSRSSRKECKEPPGALVLRVLFQHLRQGLAGRA